MANKVFKIDDPKSVIRRCEICNNRADCVPLKATPEMDASNCDSFEPIDAEEQLADLLKLADEIQSGMDQEAVRLNHVYKLIQASVMAYGEHEKPDYPEDSVFTVPGHGFSWKVHYRAQTGSESLNDEQKAIEWAKQSGYQNLVEVKEKLDFKKFKALHDAGKINDQVWESVVGAKPDTWQLRTDKVNLVCPECGTKRTKKATICNKCGYSLEGLGN